MSRPFLSRGMVLLLLAPATAAAAEPIRLAAWNIEHLGAPDEREYEGAGVRQRPTRLAQTIRALDADVLALLEIYDTDDDRATRTNALLDETFDWFELHTDDRWEYRLFANRNERDESQLTGLAWNAAKIAPVGEPYRLPLTDSTDRWNEWDRWPTAMQFSRGAGRTDFVVVPIHMKAGGGENSDQRRSEAAMLLAGLADLRAHFGDDDVVLIGDFNLLEADDPTARLLRDDREHPFVDLNEDDAATHFAGAPLDRAFFPRGRTAGEFAEAALEVVAPPGSARRDFRRNLSDHYPIVVKFDDLADDDE